MGIVVFIGHTLIPGVSGKDVREDRLDNGPLGAFAKRIFIVVCDTEEGVMAIVEAVRPILTRSGGLCLVSDAASVKQ